MLNYLNDPRPLDRRAEDRADDDDGRPALSLVRSQLDPQAAGIELMRLCRELAEDAVELNRRLDRWADDPIGGLHKARERTLEIRDAALRAPELCERLMKALRARGAFDPMTSGREG